MKTINIILVVLSLSYSSRIFGQECGHANVDFVAMIDRTGSVSDADLQAEGLAVNSLLQNLIDHGVTSVNVAIGRFPVEGEASSGAAFLFGDPQCDNPNNPCFSTDYASLQALIRNHFIDSTHPDYEGTDGTTNILSANQMAMTAFNSGESPHKIYALLSDGDPNEPVITMADDDARNSAQVLKNAGVIVFALAYDASGVDTDVTWDGGDGGGGSGNPQMETIVGDTINRLLMANIATFADNNPSRGLDGCGGDSCSEAEEMAETDDGDTFFIAATGAGLDPIFDELFQVLECPTLDACTPQECNPETNLCEPQPIPGCLPCETDEDCDDGDACTRDFCKEDLQCDATPIDPTEAPDEICTNEIDDDCDGLADGDDPDCQEGEPTEEPTGPGFTAAGGFCSLIR